LYPAKYPPVSNVIAITTSLGTRWACYSQALLERNVPEWRRIVVDGRQNWSPLGFVDRVIDEDAEFVAHVDEDCFVSNRPEMLHLIEKMRQNKNIVAAGIPDGGHYYRQRNPAALNLFFCILRLDALRRAWRDRGSWSRYQFDPKFSSQVFVQRPDLDRARVSWQDSEPYYPLFWYMLAGGGRFLYLQERLNRSRWSSFVIAANGNVVAEHLWYLRNWFSDEVMPGHDCPNRQRYEYLRNEILARYKADPRFLIALAQNNVRRYRNVVGERVIRLLKGDNV
jgi:hypothetical protein